MSIRCLLRASIAFGAAAVSGSVARGDDITPVNLTAGGPDRELPVGKAFYVAGTAPEITQSVQAIVVRKGSPVLWFGGEGPSCLELRKSFGAFLPPPGKPAAPAPPATSKDPGDEIAALDAGFTVREPGIRDANTIWAHGEGKALVTAPWERGTAKDPQPFRVLVPGDSDFFRAGYAYCLYVFSRNSAKTNVEAKVRAAFAAYEQRVEQCERGARGTAANGDAAATAQGGDAAAAAKQCNDAAATALKGDVQAIGLALHDVTRLANAARNLYVQPNRLREMIASWRAATDLTTPRDRDDKPLPSFVRRVDLPDLLPLQRAATPPPAPPAPPGRAKRRSTQSGGRPAAAPASQPRAEDPDEHHIPLAQAIARLLAHHQDGLLAQAENGSITYYAGNGATPVDRLRLLEDGKLEVSAPGTRTTTALKPSLDQLMFSTRTSARDVVELARGRLKLAKYETLKAVEAALEPALRAQPGASADQLKDLATFQAQVDGLAEVLRQAFAASERFDCGKRKYPADSALPDATADRALGEWLRCEVVEPCKPQPGAWWGDGCNAGSEPGARAWPSYGNAGDTPLDRISSAANDLLEAHRTWRSDALTLAIEQTRITEARGEAKIGFTQDTWVGSYLTPNLGYAYVPFARSSLFYVAVQLHFVPNPVDDPQWSHGAYDFARAFALEAGFAPNAGSFGPDGRLDGPWLLPPLFFGVGAHPLPYMSISGGWMRADIRTTTLAQQDRHAEWFGFVAVSLQGNLPDLLYKKLGYGLQTSVDK